jgi:probable HAF family extracellular repeat protein
MKRLVLLAWILLVPVASAYAQFNFINIDCTVAGGTAVRGINNLGEMVGNTGPDQWNLHAVLIKAGKCIPLAPNTILGTNWSDAYKINDQGDVVGYFNDDFGFPHGFLLSHKGVLTQLNFPGAGDTAAQGINASGTVVGWFDDYDAYGNFIAEHGFVWKNGSFSQVDYPGSGDTSVYAINDFGAMLSTWDSGYPDYTEHGFVRSITGKFTTYDVPVAGEIFTQGNGINDLGLFVGEYVDASVFYHGFLQVGPWFSSINYPGAYATSAWGINIFGLIVGNHFNSESDFENYILHGYVAVANGKDDVAQHLPTPPVPAKVVAAAGGRAVSRPHTNARHPSSY